MKEIILKIEEIFNLKLDNNYHKYDGFKVVTNKQEIFICIDNSSSCCEQWGYMSSEDDLNYFLESELKDIKIVDTALNVSKWKNEHEYGLDCGDAMFVNLETDKGTLQLTVYNSHNGYYGHSAFIRSNQINKEITL